MSKARKHLISAVITALLTAVTVVISRFLSINLANISIGFSFVSVMLCGMLAGPLWGGICGGLADLIGALLFPFGPYFPGFTFTAFLGGTLFGTLGIAAAKKIDTLRFAGLAVVTVLVKEAVCSLLLDTLWISILYGSDFTALLVTRLPVSAIRAVLEIACAVLVKVSVLPAVLKERNKL